MVLHSSKTTQFCKSTVSHLVAVVRQEKYRKSNMKGGNML